MSQRGGSGSGKGEIGAGAMSGVGIASLVAAVSGWLVMTGAARLLDLEDNARFLVFWSALFFCYGVLGGLQNEVTRAVSSARTTGRLGSRVMPTGLALGGGLALLVAATSPWWAPAAFPATAVPATIALSVGVVAFAGHATLAGSLAGRGQWTPYSVLVAGESVARLALAGAVAVVALSLAGLELAVAIASLTWVALVCASPRAREALQARGDGARRDFLPRVAKAMLATTATAALVVGFPVLLQLTSTQEVIAGAAPLMLAISFTRAPLMLVVNAFQGVLIAYVVQRREQRSAILARLLIAIAAVGGAGAIAAALVGPWLMVTILGPDYWLPPLTLALLTLAAVLLATLTVTGAVMLALGLHSAYAAGWVVALAVSFGLLLIPAPITVRAVLALAVGPIVGALVHAIALFRAPSGVWAGPEH